LFPSVRVRQKEKQMPPSKTSSKTPSKSSKPAKAEPAKSVEAAPAAEAAKPVPAKKPVVPGRPEQPSWTKFNKGPAQKLAKGRPFRHQGR
jgi:hypothetical protein